MNADELAKRTLWRIVSARFEHLTDDQLQAIIAAPDTESDRARVLQVSAGRTDDIQQLTDSELMQLIDNPME